MVYQKKKNRPLKQERHKDIYYHPYCLPYTNDSLFVWYNNVITRKIKKKLCFKPTQMLGDVYVDLHVCDVGTSIC